MAHINEGYDYKGRLTIEGISDRILKGASKKDESTHFYPEDLKTLLDFMASRERIIESLTSGKNDPKPVYTVKLETDDLDEIKAIVDGGATLVIERGAGTSRLTLRGGGISYLVESTNGFTQSRIEFADAYSFFNSGFTAGRQIYVDYPIPKTAGKASAKSKAREELGQAKVALRHISDIQTRHCIDYLVSAVEALIEGAE
jgi:hypothetical protein